MFNFGIETLIQHVSEPNLCTLLTSDNQRLNMYRANGICPWLIF